MSSEFTILIDDNYVMPCEIVLHFQTDPFPGGHHYEMAIPRKCISSKTWSHARFEDTESPSEHQSRNWFYWIPSIFQRQLQGDNIRAKFVLNNINELRINVDDVVFKGVCSPFVRNS